MKTPLCITVSAATPLSAAPSEPLASSLKTRQPSTVSAVESINSTQDQEAPTSRNEHVQVAPKSFMRVAMAYICALLNTFTQWVLQFYHKATYAFTSTAHSARFEKVRHDLQAHYAEWKSAPPSGITAWRFMMRMNYHAKVLAAIEERLLQCGVADETLMAEFFLAQESVAHWTIEFVATTTPIAERAFDARLTPLEQAASVSRGNALDEQLGHLREKIRHAHFVSPLGKENFFARISAAMQEDPAHSAVQL